MVHLSSPHQQLFTYLYRIVAVRIMNAVQTGGIVVAPQNLTGSWSWWMFEE